MDNWKATLETLANSPGTLNCDPPTELINDAKRALEHIRELEAEKEKWMHQRIELEKANKFYFKLARDLEGKLEAAHIKYTGKAGLYASTEHELKQANAKLAVIKEKMCPDAPLSHSLDTKWCLWCRETTGTNFFKGDHPDPDCPFSDLADAAKELQARADDHDRLQRELEELYRTTEERVSRMVESHVKAVLQPLELETNAFYISPDPESDEAEKPPCPTCSAPMSRAFVNRGEDISKHTQEWRCLNCGPVGETKPAEAGK